MKARFNHPWPFRLPVIRHFDGWTSPWGVVYFKWGEEQVKHTELWYHEQAHLEQMQRDGRIRFMIAYGAQFILNLLDCWDWWEAYRNISYEVEAREVAKDRMRSNGVTSDG